jgi:hypothetical protein
MMPIIYHDGSGCGKPVAGASCNPVANAGTTVGVYWKKQGINSIVVTVLQA